MPNLFGYLFVQCCSKCQVMFFKSCPGSHWSLGDLHLYLKVWECPRDLFFHFYTWAKPRNKLIKVIALAFTLLDIRGAMWALNGFKDGSRMYPRSINKLQFSFMVYNLDSVIFTRLMPGHILLLFTSVCICLFVC